MGARKRIDVTGANKNTAPDANGGIYTHCQIFASDGVTKRTNPFPLNASVTIGNNGMLNIADDAIYFDLGTAGSTVVGQLADSVLIAMLDSSVGFPLGATTDVAKFGTDANMTGSGDIAPFALDAYKAAVSF